MWNNILNNNRVEKAASNYVMLLAVPVGFLFCVCVCVNKLEVYKLPQPATLIVAELEISIVLGINGSYR